MRSRQALVSSPQINERPEAVQGLLTESSRGPGGMQNCCQSERKSLLPEPVSLHTVDRNVLSVKSPSTRAKGSSQLCAAVSTYCCACCIGVYDLSLARGSNIASAAAASTMRCISSCSRDRPTHHSRPPPGHRATVWDHPGVNNDDFDLSASSRKQFQTPAANRHRLIWRR